MNTHNRSLLRGWGGEQLPCSHQHVIFALLEFYYYYFFFGLSFGRQLPKPAGPINHLLSCICVHIGGNNFSFNSNPFFFWRACTWTRSGSFSFDVIRCGKEHFLSPVKKKKKLRRMTDLKSRPLMRFFFWLSFLADLPVYINRRSCLTIFSLKAWGPKLMHNWVNVCVLQQQ